MKLVLFSDLHAHNHSDFSKPLPNGRGSRLQDALDVMSQAGTVATKVGASAILFLGDLFHSRFNIDADVLFGVSEQLNKLAEQVPVYCLRGNHDTFDNRGLVHSLVFAGENLEILDLPISLMIGDARVTAIPWMEDTNEIKRLLQSGPAGDLLIMHAALKEGKLGPSDHKIDAKLGVGDLPLDKFKWVFLGDYHKHQELVPNRVMYCGSPLQLTFGERGEDKFILVLDTVTGEIQKIPTDAPRFFKFSSAKEFDDAVNSGIVRPDKDFIKVEYQTEEAPSVETLVTEFESVKFERQKTVNTQSRCGAHVLSDDVALVSEHLRNAPGDIKALADYGLEILEAIQ